MSVYYTGFIIIAENSPVVLALVYLIWQIVNPDLLQNLYKLLVNPNDVPI